MRHLGVGLAAVALLFGSAVWLVEQAPAKKPPPPHGVSVHASPGAFDDSTWATLRSRPLDGPGVPCAARTLSRGPVGAELLDITSRLPDSLWRWHVDDRYAGPVLVRGVEAGGTRVAFQLPGGQIYAGESGEPIEGGGFPELTLIAPEYRFVAGAVSAWVEVRFPVSGCYAIQVDGLGFQQREVLAV